AKAFALNKRIQEAIVERGKKAHDERARAAIADARQLFDSNRYQDAIDLLTQFAPSHPAVDATLVSFREDVRQIEALRKQQAAAAATRRKIAEQLATGQDALHRDDFAGARTILTELTGLSADGADVQAFKRALEQAEAAASLRVKLAELSAQA